MALAVSIAAMAFFAPSGFAGEITLTSLNDPAELDVDGDCTLREAIEEANTDSPGTSVDCHFTGQLNSDVINLPAGHLTIGATGGDENGPDKNHGGDFDVLLHNAGNLTINGAGEDQTILDGAGTDRLFQAFNQSSAISGVRAFTLNDMTLTGGSAQGGGAIGIWSLFSTHSDVNLNRVNVTGNHSEDAGGGGILIQDAYLNLNDSKVTNNSNTSSNQAGGGGVSVRVNTGQKGGFHATNSDISNNAFTAIGAGPWQYWGTSGGVWLWGRSDAGDGSTIENTRIANNEATPVGQVVTQGIGLFAHDTSLSIRGSEISGNVANTLPVGRSSANAGIRFEATDPTFTHDSTMHLDITNSTIANNDAGPSVDPPPGSIGADGADSYSGGLAIHYGHVTLTNVTFTGNEADHAKDLTWDPFGSQGGVNNGGTSLKTKNSIFADADACYSVFNLPAAATQGGNIEANGHTCNLAGGAAGAPGANGDREDVAPSALALQPLADNGGPTQTAALGSGSVALDAVPVAQCTEIDGTTALETDQRGLPRPGGAACDSGAYEATDCLGSPVTKIGTSGNDTIVGTAGDDSIAALGGNDTIDGAGGADKICAGDGDDTVTPGLDMADDTVDAGIGNDTVSYASSTVPVTVDLGAGTGIGQGNDTLTGFENVIGGSGADDLTGDSGPNAITGGLGADTISALDGADSVFVRDGLGDTADCGLGTDTAQSDVVGTDALTDCEDTEFTESPPAGGDTGPGPGPGTGQGPGPGVATGPTGKRAAALKKCKKKKGKKKKKKCKKKAKKLPV